MKLAKSSLSALLIALLLGLPRMSAAEELRSFEVVARDGRIAPERLEVPAGRRVKLALKNEGKGPIEFENLDLRVEKVLAPGASSFVVLPSLKPGSYRFVDEFHPDTGTLLIIAK